MRLNSFSNRSGISLSASNSIESLTKYFQLPLPCFSFSHRDPLEVYSLVQESLIQHNKKAKKLSDLTKDLMVLCENFNKDLRNLEAFKVQAEKKIESLQGELDEKQEELETVSLKSQILNNYVEEVEKNYALVMEEREILKQDLSLNKKNARAAQGRLESQVDEQKRKYKERVQEKERVADRLRVELLSKEKYIEELLVEIERIEAEYELEKLKNAKLFEELNRRGEEVFKLRSRLGEVRIGGNECFGEINQDLALAFKHSEGFKEDIIEGVNELMELEKEQDLDHELNLVNLETAEDFDDGQERRRDRRSTIFLLPGGSKDKYVIEKCEGFEIASVKVNKNFTLSETCGVSCWPAKNSSMRKATPALRVIRAKLSQHKTQKFLRERFNRSASRRVLKTETWTDSIATQKSPEHSNTNSSPTKPAPNIVNEHVPDDPVKDYFIKLCRSIKLNSYSSKILQIPTQTLYNNLLKSKIPLCNWPETIKLYLYKRLA